MCRFGSRNSFLDHVNRRGMVLTYKCPQCPAPRTFYNTCSFLLHAREHFTEKGGAINLDDIDIATIPMDIAGFMPIANIKRLYDTEDDSIAYNLKISAKVYKPSEECIGKKIVNFVPHDLLFFCTTNNSKNLIPKDSVPMILVQVNKHIPKCVFVRVAPSKPSETVQSKMNPVENIRQNNNCGNESGSDGIVISEDEDDVICLDDDSDEVSIGAKSTSSETPKIQVKNMNLLLSKHFTQHVNAADRDCVRIVRNGNPADCVRLIQRKGPIKPVEKLPDCPECKETKIMSMIEHFLAGNRPMDNRIKCNKCGLVSPSQCSLRAHMRIHDRKAPFICPECGKGFDKWATLSNHMEDVCFHTAKNVRYKCPAKKCGKVFAQTLTFSSHFPVAHTMVRISCRVCSESFKNEIEYAQHSVKHNDQPAENLKYKKIMLCTVCEESVNDIKEHVWAHIKDNDSRIYVYICKYCRSYYRSKQTYAAHLLRCQKLRLNSLVKKELEMKRRIIKYCKTCKKVTELSQKDEKIETYCRECLTPHTTENEENRTFHEYEYTKNPYVRKDAEIDAYECVLCDNVLSVEETACYDKHLCKYHNPVVMLNKVNVSSEMLDSFEYIQVSPNSADDSQKRKRKRLFNGSVKNKRSSFEKPTEEVLTASPVLFDGEYKCKLCRYKSQSRQSFHDHIQEHRDVSTSYQCMECGECFVVKPSLLKHLQVFHLIEDVESYINENECFDKEAVRLLEENMRMVPGEVKEPVADNQCRICRQMFTDAQELSKHFRVHGMAFLMKKIIK